MTDNQFTLNEVLQSGGEINLNGYRLSYDFTVNKEEVESHFILTDPEGNEEFYPVDESGAARAWRRMATLNVVP